MHSSFLFRRFFLALKQFFWCWFSFCIDFMTKKSKLIYFLHLKTHKHLIYGDLGIFFFRWVFKKFINKFSLEFQTKWFGNASAAPTKKKKKNIQQKSMYTIYTLKICMHKVEDDDGLLLVVVINLYNLCARKMCVFFSNNNNNSHKRCARPFYLSLANFKNSVVAGGKRKMWKIRYCVVFEAKELHKMLSVSVTVDLCVHTNKCPRHTTSKNPWRKETTDSVSHSLMCNKHE